MNSSGVSSQMFSHLDSSLPRQNRPFPVPLTMQGPSPGARPLPLRDNLHPAEAPAQSWLLQPSCTSSLPQGCLPGGLRSPHSPGAVVLSKVFWTSFGKCTCGRTVPHDPKHDLEGDTPSPGPFRAPKGKPSDHTDQLEHVLAVYGSQMFT